MITDLGYGVVVAKFMRYVYIVLIESCEQVARLDELADNSVRLLYLHPKNINNDQ